MISRIRDTSKRGTQSTDLSAVDRWSRTLHLYVSSAPTVLGFCEVNSSKTFLLPVFIFKQSIGIRFLEQNFFIQDFQKPSKSFLHKSARSSLNSKPAAKIASLIAHLYLNLALMRSLLMLPDRGQTDTGELCQIADNHNSAKSVLQKYTVV